MTLRVLEMRTLREPDKEFPNRAPVRTLVDQRTSVADTVLRGRQAGGEQVGYQRASTREIAGSSLGKTFRIQLTLGRGGTQIL